MTNKQKQFLERLHNSKRSKYGTWKCDVCNQIFETKSKLKEHNIKYHNQKLSKMINGKTVCPYCIREFNSVKSYAAHSSRCKLNPKYNSEKIKNRYEKQGQTYKNNIKNGLYSPSFLGKKHSIESKQKISLKRVKNMSEDFVSGKRKDVKWYRVKNIKGVEFTVRGHWEENVALKLNEMGILWTKNDFIEYFDGYMIRHYVPDFCLNDLNSYVEVKGYYPEEDKRKMKFVTEQHKDKKFYMIGQNEYKDFINGKLNLEQCQLV